LNSFLLFPSLACVALFAAAPVFSQHPVILQSGINATTQQAEVARSMLAHQKSLATTADGRLWALAHWEDGSYTSTNKLDPQSNASRYLLLMSSQDGGQSWKRVTPVRTTGSHYGSIVTDPDGYRLHIAWYAWNGNKDSSSWISSIFYAVYDTRQNAWAAPDTTVVAGTNSSSGTYSSADIAVTEAGVVGITFSCARGVPPGWVGGTGSWHSGFIWLKGSSWSAPHRINEDSSGVLANVHAVGTDFYMSYRVTTGGYGIAVRRFDTTTDAWGPEGEMPAVASTSNPSRNISNLRASNSSHLLVQPNGDLYLLYGTGTSSTTGGKLWVAYSPAGSYVFNTPMQIDDDSGMGWGNSTYRFYTLVRDASGTVGVLYSKSAESYANLYLRLVNATTTLPPYPTPAPTLISGAADQFQPFISGYRSQLGSTGLMATYTDRRVLGPLTGGSVRFCRQCRGLWGAQGQRLCWESRRGAADQRWLTSDDREQLGARAERTPGVEWRRGLPRCRRPETPRRRAAGLSI
jgi:hypothetical protein